MSIESGQTITEIDIDKLDVDHRNLLSRINSLCEKMTDDNLEHERFFVLSEIHAAVSLHFRHEETAMQKCQYSSYSIHKADHDNLLAQIRNFMEDFDSDGEATLHRTLMLQLNDKLAEHVEKMDNAFIKAVRDPSQ